MNDKNNKNQLNQAYFQKESSSKNTENNSNINKIQEHKDQNSRGIYLRDDHCDWGSSGMNEFTQEFSDKE